MTKIEISTMKIGREFNSCPGREEIIRAIKRKGLAGRIEYVDLPEKNYWQNNECTLVFKVKIPQRFETGIQIGQLAAELGADELNYGKENQTEYIIRFWWD